MEPTLKKGGIMIHLLEDSISTYFFYFLLYRKDDDDDDDFYFHLSFFRLSRHLHWDCV